MRIEKRLLNSGEYFYYIPIKFKAGEKLLLKSGFVPCKNPKYFEREINGKYQSLHFNNLMKCWLLDYIPMGEKI